MRSKLALFVASLVFAFALFAHVARADCLDAYGNPNGSCPPGLIQSDPDVVVSETVATIVCPQNSQRLVAHVCDTNSNNSVSITPAKVGDATVSSSRGEYFQWGSCRIYPTSAAIFAIALSSANTTLGCTEILRK
jgi:hypothetical protein